MSEQSAFKASLAYLDELYHRPLIPASQVRLERIRFLLDKLDNPHRSFRSVHVAGSTGKGSTTAMVASILRSAGFRTGLFSSPHLESIRERIMVGDEWVTEHEWGTYWTRALPIVDGMVNNRHPGYDLGRPAYFEVLFALMAMHFAATDVEWAAVETGMGGRLDATNTLLPDVAVITNISLEHTKILGDTTPKIAGEKAGILKPGAHAVTAADDREALRVIRRRAGEVGVPLLEVPRDVEAVASALDLTGQDLSIRSPASVLTLRLPLAGEFQRINAATAYAAGLSLQTRGVNVSENDLASGLSNARAPGRFEVVSRDPFIILDGAHNPAAAGELRQSLEQLLPGVSIVLLFAAMGDKDLKGMAREIGPLASRIYVSPVPGAHRPNDVDAVVDAFLPFCTRVEREMSAEIGLERAIDVTPVGGALVVCGSMYLVGSVRAQLTSAVMS